MGRWAFLYSEKAMQTLLTGRRSCPRRDGACFDDTDMDRSVGDKLRGSSAAGGERSRERTGAVIGDGVLGANAINDGTGRTQR